MAPRPGDATVVKEIGVEYSLLAFGGRAPILVLLVAIMFKFSRKTGFT
jgi:hypothetical protein